MAQVTINIEPHDKDFIKQLCKSLAGDLKLNSMSQADVVHYLIEYYKENQ